MRTTGSQWRTGRGQRCRAEEVCGASLQAYLNRWVFRDDFKVGIETD